LMDTTVLPDAGVALYSNGSIVRNRKAGTEGVERN
jgi:hypothetical protein